MATTKTAPCQCRQFINGHWVAGSGEMLENRSPARIDEVLGLVPRGTEADADAAVAAAREAFPAWRRTSRIRRGELFLKLTDLIRSRDRHARRSAGRGKRQGAR